MTDALNTIDYGERGRVRIVEDSEALARAAAEFVIDSAREAVDRKGCATIVLSGGSTPKQMGRLLAQDGYQERISWDKVHFFWGDERWVPLESPDSNAGEAKRAFLDHVGVPSANVHPFDVSSISPAQAATRYESLVRSITEPNAGIPAFDLILLGMGDDGHTASLFPGTDAVHEKDRLVISHYVPAVNADRLTMTPPLLNAGRNVAFLAAGSGKADRLAEVLEGPVNIDRLPAQAIRPAGGPTWIVDRAAAASLAKQTG